MDLQTINNFLKSGIWNIQNEVTLFLAKVIGLYLIIMGLYLLFRYDKIKTVSSEFAKSPALQTLSGILSLIIGLLIIVGHQVWMWDWPVLITIFGYLGVVKGITRLFFPEWNYERKWTHSTFLVYSGALWVLLGLFLVYKGFWQ